MKTIALVLLLALSACIELPSRQQRGTDRLLRIATWNMEHLAERDGEGCRPRSEADYATMRRYATELGVHLIPVCRSGPGYGTLRICPRSRQSLP